MQLSETFSQIFRSASHAAFVPVHYQHMSSRRTKRRRKRRKEERIKKHIDGPNVKRSALTVDTGRGVGKVGDRKPCHIIYVERDADETSQGRKTEAEHRRNGRARMRTSISLLKS
jgi:hypothetical protein